MKAPREYVIRRLLQRSQSQNFDEARREFLIQGVQDSTSEDFSPKCELCDQGGLKHNFILEHEKTGEILRVGSRCILRFGIGKGIYDVESGRVFLQNIVDEKLLLEELRGLYGTILPLTPEAYDVKQYVDRMRKYFSIRGIENPTTEQLLELIPPERRKTVGIYEQYRLRQLWEKPGTIDTLRTKKRIRTTQNPKEGQTWYKKRRRVQTTLARSDSYKDPYERT
jgi:hypothetical protein